MASIFDKIKKSLNDDTGFFRQGKFTPVTQITGKPLIQQQQPQKVSPLGSQNMATNYGFNPAQSNVDQTPFIEPEKPTFKTSAAEKLNSRMDSIKRFGTSNLNEVEDNIKTIGSKLFDTFKSQQEIKFGKTDGGFKKQAETSLPGAIANKTKQVFGNLNTPEKLEAYNDLPVENFGQGVESFVKNNYVAPIAQIPYNINQIFGKEKTPIERGMGALGTLGGVASIVPDPTDLIFPAVKYAEGVKKETRDGKKGLTALKDSLKYLTGQEQVGFGDAFATTEEGKTVGNLAEIPLMLFGGMTVAKQKQMTKTILDSQDDINRAIRGIRNYDKFTPETQMQIIQDAIEVNNKIIPDIIKTKEMKSLFATDPLAWMNTTSKFLEDRIVSAKNPTLNLGFNVQKLKQLPEGSIEKIEKPQTELDWKIFNQKKPETTSSVADILSTRKIEAPQPITVKGSAIDVDQLESEGWDLSQIDYAIRQANKAKKDPENAGAYVRGVLKKQYPNQASKMGKQSEINQKNYEDFQESKLEEVRANNQIDEILTPKSELEKLTQAKKAELDYADIKRAEITEMMKKEGFDTSTPTAEKIMSGEIPASPALRDALQKHSKALGSETVKYKNLPEDKLKQNYVPNVRKDAVTPVDTDADGFVGMMNRNTFNPTKKRNNLIDEENLADVGTAFRQGHISILNSKYYDADQANKIVKQYNIPEEKSDEVLNFVKQEREQADKITTDHIDKTAFGVKHDYLSDAKSYDEKLSGITGVKVERPSVPHTHSNWIINSIDNMQSLIRGDAMFFKDKTSKEINDAFLDFRVSQTGEIKQPYTASLNKFINKLTKYDYEDPAVRQRVNQFIDDKLKENKVVQTLGDKTLRGATEVFSMAQIGGNVKTAIAQPTETFRIIPEHGIKPFLKGVTTAFDKNESNRLSTEYGLEKEISGNLAQNPLYKQVNDDPAFKDKIYDSFKNFLFKGLEATENWKNVAYASALEDAGKTKGLNGQELKRFVTQEMLRLAHVADTDMTPRIMKNNAVGSSLLQYSQYLLKNEVLKWDTAVSKDLKTAEKMKKLTGLFLADLAAVGALSAFTGVGVNGAKGWLTNSGLPSNLGPILTVPFDMAKEAFEFSKLSPEEQEKESSLMDKEKAIILRNFIPMGNQISKTKNALKIMDKGYAESKKGNVNFVVGDMNPIQKVQATIFGQGAIPAKKEADKKWKNLKKDGIFPTLTKNQSEILKSLPKEEQKSYYDKQQENQISNEDKIKKATGKDEKSIFSIFGKKEESTKNSIASILNSDTATQAEKAVAKSEMKAFIDAGQSSAKSDEDLKSYFFNEVDKMPENIASEKQAKNIAKFKKLDSIYSSETLDQETKDRLVKLSGISSEDVTYYNNAKDDATVKAIRQEELAGTISRDEWLSQLEDGRKLVGNKQIVDNATLNELYERGLLNDADRDYLLAVKYDPVKGKYYVDRDYKNKQASGASAKSKKQLTALRKLRDKLESESGKTSAKSTKTITDYLNKKPQVSSETSKTIGSILSGKKSQKNITQSSNKTAKVKYKSRYQK